MYFEVCWHDCDVGDRDHHDHYYIWLLLWHLFFCTFVQPEQFQVCLHAFYYCAEKKESLVIKELIIYYFLVLGR